MRSRPHCPNVKPSRPASNSVLALLLLLAVAAPAHAGRFPAKARWLEVKQQGVTLIVPAGWERYGLYALQRGLVHLDSLHSWYGPRPSVNRIILNPWQDAPVDLATVMPLRVELTLTPVIDKGIRPQAGLFLDLVTAHELTHTVQMATHAGITKPLRWLFGDAVAPLGISPDWTLEGQAIWTESRAGGGRLHSSWHRQLLRTRLIEGKPWSAAQIAYPGTVSPDANRAYIAGAFLYDDLIREHGGAVAAARWMKSRARWPFVLSIPTRKVYGSGGVDLYRNFLASWMRRWKTEHPDRENLPQGIELARAPRTSWRRAEWTGSGNLIAVEQSYDHPLRLVSLDPGRQAVGLPGKVAALGYTSHFGSTPYRGGAIVSEYRRGRWATETGSVYLVRVDSLGRHHPLANPPLAGFAPAWSPAANRLAYVTKTPEGPHELRTVRLNGEGVVAGEPVTLFKTELGILGEPAWSPDGRRLAFVFDRGEGERIGVCGINGDSLSVIRITGAANTIDPAFAPDGSLWVAADPDGVLDLFQIDLDAPAALRRTFVSTAAVEPAPGPGGEIVYGFSTSQGLIPVLLSPGEMRADSAGVIVRTQPLADFQVQDPPLPTSRGLTFRSYSALAHSAPIFWMPAAVSGDESALGLALIARDPLGLLSWQLDALQGLDSGEPDLTLSGSWRTLPAEISGWLRRSPVKQASYIWDPTDAVYLYDGKRWRSTTEGGLTLAVPIQLDGNGYSAQSYPWVGWVTRERGYGIGVDPAHLSWQRSRYNGVRAGVQYVRGRGAARDPVSRHYLSANLFGERNLPESMSDLHAALIEARLRWHFPGPVNTTVLALTAAAQQQDYALINFSRAGVRPRGYSDEHLDPAWIQGGRLARVGAELHLPLLFPDWGWGMGAWYLQRITGLLFVEAADSWARGTSHEPVSSLGAELVLRGTGLYKLPVTIRVGVAWRQRDRAVVPYLTWSLPLSAVSGGGNFAGRDDDALTGRGFR